MAQVSNSLNITANGTTQGVTAIGPIVLILTGTFDSATIQLQVRPPGGSYINVTDGSFTAAAAKVFNFPANTKNDYRVSVSGGGGSLDVDMLIQAD